MPVSDTKSVLGGFGQVILNDWALGDDRIFTGEAQNAPNPPPTGDLDLSKVFFSLKLNPNDTDSNAIIFKQITQALTSAGQITAGLGGHFTSLTLHVLSSDYEGLVNAGTPYWWDFRCVTQTGQVTFTLATGTVTFVQNVTQTNAVGTPAGLTTNNQPRFRGFTNGNPATIAGASVPGDFYFNSAPFPGTPSGWVYTLTNGWVAWGIVQDS